MTSQNGHLTSVLKMGKDANYSATILQWSFVTINPDQKPVLKYVAIGGKVSI
jgi:hypothetical protein